MTIFAPRRTSSPAAVKAKPLQVAAQESLAAQDSKAKLGTTTSSSGIHSTSTPSRPATRSTQAGPSPAPPPFFQRKTPVTQIHPPLQSQAQHQEPQLHQSQTLHHSQSAQHWHQPQQPQQPPPALQPCIPPSAEQLHAAAAAAVGSGGGGASQLFSRRLAQRGSSAGEPGRNPRPQLQIETTRPEDQPNHRRIRRCGNFGEVYRMGGQLMPSVHRDMEVRTATRRGGDREDVVVKIRWKKGSFHGRGEEKAWRANTEVMLNLPPTSSIAQIHEVLEDDVAYYVIMEKVGGMDLFETLQHDGKLSLDEIRDVLRQLLAAVHKLHSNGCIHKDLKLENVMLDRTPTARPTSQSCPPWPRQADASGVGTPLRKAPTRPGANSRRSSTCSNKTLPFTGTVKLIDFDTVEEWTPKSPKAKDVLGTDQYIAPEAYEGRYSPASDIFAVGVIAYKLLTGVFPFRCAIFDDEPGDNWVGSPKMKEIKGKIEDERLDWRHPVFGAYPGLQHLVARMLAANEHHRPSTREVLSDPWFMAAQPAVPPPRRHSVSTHWLLPHCVDEGN